MLPVGPAVLSRRPRPLLREQAYERLRHAILQRHLAPEQRLFDDELRSWLGMSMTPIRDALTRLSADGLAEDPDAVTAPGPCRTRDSRRSFQYSQATPPPLTVVPGVRAYAACRPRSTRSRPAPERPSPANAPRRRGPSRARSLRPPTNPSRTQPHRGD